MERGERSEGRKYRDTGKSQDTGKCQDIGKNQNDDLRRSSRNGVRQLLRVSRPSVRISVRPRSPIRTCNSTIRTRRSSHLYAEGSGESVGCSNAFFS